MNHSDNHVGTILIPNKGTTCKIIMALQCQSNTKILKDEKNV